MQILAYSKKNSNTSARAGKEEIVQQLMDVTERDFSINLELQVAHHCVPVTVTYFCDIPEANAMTATSSGLLVETPCHLGLVSSADINVQRSGTTGTSTGRLFI